VLNRKERNYICTSRLVLKKGKRERKKKKKNGILYCNVTEIYRTYMILIVKVYEGKFTQRVVKRCQDNEMGERERRERQA